jgi:hypothetical protein
MFKKFRHLLCASLCLAAAVFVAACGGSEDDDESAAYVRVVNATSDLASLDLYTGTDKRFAAVAAKTVSDYISLAASTYNMRVHDAGGDTILAAADRTLSAGVYQTLVVYGRDGALKSTLLSDTETAPTSGTAKVRVFNSSSEPGALDVYFTSSSADLDASSPAIAVDAGYFSSYTEVNKGTYRLRITGSGDTTDLRLDLSSITLADQQVLTLILTPGESGVLVHALVLSQQGSLNAMDNPHARVRVVAAVGNNGSVSAAVGGTALASAQRSPSVGSYALVAAGTQPFAASVNGTALADTTLTTTPGADATLLFYGDPAAPQYKLLADDNRPAASSSKARLRLVHGVGGLGSGLSMTLNYGVVVNDQPEGTASTPVAVTAGTDNTLEASSPLSSTALYSGTELTLAAQGVYTLFMLGGSASPVGVLRRDH